MKLSAFLAVSVPMVTMSQAAAVAADNASTGAWLQQSIASLAPAKAAAPARKPAAKRVAHASPPASLKFRPFKPGRYLPSETELRRAAMVAQQAQYDYSADQQNSGALSGQVSAMYAPAAAPRPRSIYDQYAVAPGGYGNTMSAAPVYSQPRVKPAKKAIGTRAPRVIPQQMPVVPEQITQVPGTNMGIQPMIPEPPVQRQVRAQFPVSMPVAPFPQPSAQVSQQQMMQQQFQQQQQMMQQQAFPTCEFTPQEISDLHRRVELDRPTMRTNFNGDMFGQADNPSNGIGQSASPLNFFGGGAMQALAHSGPKPHVPPARFGSWHGNAGLAHAGFHTYVARRQPMMYEYSRPMPVAKPMKRKAAAYSKRASFSAPPSVAARKQVMVATYPSYSSPRGLTY